MNIQLTASFTVEANRLMLTFALQYGASLVNKCQTSYNCLRLTIAAQ